MRLTFKEKVLLRRLVVRGDREWSDVASVAFDRLQSLGYAKRAGRRGRGRLAGATKRGVLVALAERLIPHHPDDPEPASNMMVKDRVAAALNR